MANLKQKNREGVILAVARLILVSKQHRYTGARCSDFVSGRSRTASFIFISLLFVVTKKGMKTLLSIPPLARYGEIP